MLDAGAEVIDLSGAFRLRTAENYTALVQRAAHRSPSCWPKPSTDCPNSAATAIRAARLISNPGCYPTAANLAIRPLIEAGVIDRARRNRLRRQDRRQRRGPQAQPQDQLLRSHREFLRLFDSRSPPRAGGAADLRPRGARVQLHGAAAAASTAAFSRPSTSAPSGRTNRRGPARDLSTSATPASRSSGCTTPGQVPDLRAVARTNFCDIGVTVRSGNRARRGGQRDRQSGQGRRRPGRSRT